MVQRKNKVQRFLFKSKFMIEKDSFWKHRSKDLKASYAPNSFLTNKLEIKLAIYIRLTRRILITKLWRSIIAGMAELQFDHFRIVQTNKWI